MSFAAARLVGVALSALITGSLACAQTRGAAIGAGAVALGAGEPVGPRTTLEGELRQLSGQAGVIFAGEVLAVRPQVDMAWGASSGWVEVEFRVDQAIRGCTGGTTYVLREWSGLWAGGQQRYTVGQRLLMLLHSPSASGLSSPVGGQEGVIPLTGDGAAPGPRDGFANAAEQGVDLRWVQSRVVRMPAGGQSSPVQVLQPVSGSAGSGGTVRREGTARMVTPQFERSPETLPLASVRVMSLRSVVALLKAPEAEVAHAAR